MRSHLFLASFKSVAIVAALLSVAGCRATNRGDSSVKVINGIESTQGQMPYVVKYNAGSSWCSGAFINSSIVLTASHCVVHNFRKLNASDVSIGGITAKNIILATSDYEAIYEKAMTERTNETRWDMVRRDLALIVFPNGTAQDLGISLSSIKGIKKTAPTVGTEIFIMGFGMADDNDSSTIGVKRWGTNTLSYVGSTVVYYPSASGNTPGVNSGAASGDSGGPILERSTQTIIGVTSWGFGGFEYAPSLRSTYATSLFAASNAAGNEFIDY